MKFSLFKIIIGVLAFTVIMIAVGVFLTILVAVLTLREPDLKPQAKDYKSLTYVVDNEPITLNDGYYESLATPGSASKTVIRYFGNEATGDLDIDGSPDKAFLLTKDPGGSGMFYYVAAAINHTDSYVPTNTILLGDRIAPQTTTIDQGFLTVNYAERKSGDPMTAVPSVGVSKYFQLSQGNLVEYRDNQKPADTCYIGGCSGQICSDKNDIITTCIYHQEYACYKDATCERQQNGQCGWTTTPKLEACLKDASAQYACRIPCTGMNPDASLVVACNNAATQNSCLQIQSANFPYQCEWRRADYQCPAYP